MPRSPLPSRLVRLSCLLLGVGALVGCAPGAAPRTSPRTAADSVTEGMRLRAWILRAEDRRRVDPELLEAASHDDPEIRARALLALGRIGDTSHLAIPLRGLADPEPRVRAEAAWALGLLADATAVPALGRAAEDPDARVRTAVADALGLLKDPSSAEALQRLLRDRETSVLAAGCLAAARFDDPSFAVGPLVSLSNREEHDVLWSCTYALSRLAGRPKALGIDSRALARRRMIELAGSTLPEVRRLAAAGLNLPSSDEEAVTLGRLIEDPDPSVRIAAIDSLTFPGAPLEPFLVKVLRDPDDRVMLALVEGLGRLRGDAAAVEQLSRLLVFDDRLWLRVEAARALGEIGRVAAPVARGLSTAENPELRRAAADLLRAHLDEELEPLARRLYTDDDRSVRAEIIPVLAEIDEPLGDLLAEAIASTDPTIRRAVARAVARRFVQPDRDEADLEEGLGILRGLWPDADDDDPGLVLEILDAAGRAGRHPGARELLLRGLSSPDRRVRVRSIGHLERVYGEDHADAAGPATNRPLADYLEILGWAEGSHAAVVTVERPGFLPGRFTVALDTREAPLTTWSFARLARSGFYNGSVARRVPNRLVQTGDPPGEVAASADPIRDELRAARFWPGTLGMATTEPDEARGPWFVALTPQPLLSATNTAFGHVVRNFTGVAALILPGDRVVSIEIYEGDGSEPLPPLGEGS